MPPVSRYWGISVTRAQVGLGQKRNLLVCNWTQPRRTLGGSKWRAFPEIWGTCKPKTAEPRENSAITTENWGSWSNTNTNITDFYQCHKHAASHLNVDSRFHWWSGNFKSKQRNYGKRMLWRGFAPSNMGLVWHEVLQIWEGKAVTWLTNKLQQPRSGVTVTPGALGLPWLLQERMKSSTKKEPARPARSHHTSSLFLWPQVMGNAYLTNILWQNNWQGAYTISNRILLKFQHSKHKPPLLNMNKLEK